MILNIPRIVGVVERAEAEALNRVAAKIVADARHRAPVRKVFKERPGFRRKFRPLSGAEKAIAIRRAEHFYTNVRPSEFARRRAVSHIRNYSQAEIPRRSSRNNIKNSGKLRVLGYKENRRFKSTSGAFVFFNRKTNRTGYEPGETLGPLLTTRGKYEARSGRGVTEVVHRGRVEVRLGGRLKNSIEAEAITMGKNGPEVNVTAKVRYAKFVEFPTVHNAAQPFLRPALHGAREDLRRETANEIRQALGGQ